LVTSPGVSFVGGGGWNEPASFTTAQHRSREYGPRPSPSASANRRAGESSRNRTERGGSGPASGRRRTGKVSQAKGRGGVHVEQVHALALCVATVAAVSASTVEARADVIKQTKTLAPRRPLHQLRIAPLVFQKFDPASYSTQQRKRRARLGHAQFVRAGSEPVLDDIRQPATITESFSPDSAGSGGPHHHVAPDGKTPVFDGSGAEHCERIDALVTYGNKAGSVFPQTFSSSLASTSPFLLSRPARRPRPGPRRSPRRRPGPVHQDGGRP